MKPLPPDLRLRNATITDSVELAQLNRQLIGDEGHRNVMSLAELQDRMATWLQGEYAAVIAEREGDIVGYALFRESIDHLYLRQLFVSEAARRQGVGRAIVEWVRQHADGGDNRLRIDVLIGNEPAIAFWHAMGFKAYCITMEWGALT